MPTRLTAKAVEESTYIVTASFVDEEGNAVTPNELTWTLTDRFGNVVNARADVVITPAASVDIVLTGEDLPVAHGARFTVLKLTLIGTYDSSLGDDLPINDEATFTVYGLIAV